MRTEFLENEWLWQSNNCTDLEKKIQIVNLNLVCFPLLRFQNHRGKYGQLQHKFCDNDMPFLAE